MSAMPPGADAGSTPIGPPQRVRIVFRHARWVLAGLLLLPVAELAVAILVAHWIGAWPTVFALLVLSAIGLVILRREGLGAWRAMVDAAAAGEAPTAHRDPVDAMLMLLVGLLFLVPGFITAAVGAVLAVPAARRGLRRTLGKRISLVSTTGGPWWIESRGRPSEVVVGEVVTDRPPAPPPARSIEPAGPEAPPDGASGASGPDEPN